MFRDTMEYSGWFLWIFVIYWHFSDCRTLTLRRDERNTLSSLEKVKRETFVEYTAGRVRRDVTGGGICNINTALQCGCYQCDDDDQQVDELGVVVPCCSSNLPESISSKGVLLSLTVDAAETTAQISPSFEAMLRQAIAELINSICQITAQPSDNDENYIICSDIYLTFSNSSATSVVPSNIVIFSSVEYSVSSPSTSVINTDQVSGITVSMSVVNYPLLCDTMASCSSKASVQSQSSLLDLLATHNASLEQLLPGGTSVISVSPWMDAMPASPSASFDDPEETGELRMDLIITGGVFGGLLLCTCMISAAKAVRDRKRIQQRRAQKRMDRLRSNGSCTQLTGSTEAAHSAENGGFHGLLNGEPPLISPMISPEGTEDNKAKQLNGHCQNGLVVEKNGTKKKVSNGKVRNGESKFVQVVNVTIEMATDRHEILQEKEEVLKAGEKEECEVVKKSSEEVGEHSKPTVVTNGSVITESGSRVTQDIEDDDTTDKLQDEEQQQSPSVKEEVEDKRDKNSGLWEEDKEQDRQQETPPPDYNEVLLLSGVIAESGILHESQQRSDITEKKNSQNDARIGQETGHCVKDCLNGSKDNSTGDMVDDVQNDAEGQCEDCSDSVSDKLLGQDTVQNNDVENATKKEEATASDTHNRLEDFRSNSEENMDMRNRSSKSKNGGSLSSENNDETFVMDSDSIMQTDNKECEYHDSTIEHELEEGAV